MTRISQKKPTAGLYTIENLVNGKRYVGSSVDVNHRMIGHKSYLRRNIHGNEHLQSAWNKYGESAFRFRILVFLEQSELTDTEKRLIRAWNLTDRKCGYNKTDETAAPLKGKKHSDEARRRISQGNRGKKHQMTPAGRESLVRSLTGNKRSAGRPVSQETRDKISRSNTGKPHTIPVEKIDGWKAKQRARMLGNRYGVGIIQTEEHRKKISSSLKAFHAQKRRNAHVS